MKHVKFTKQIITQEGNPLINIYIRALILHNIFRFKGLLKDPGYNT